DVYQTIRLAMDGAVEGEELECTRLDDILAPGAISADLLNELETSAICVADATGLNANVMWEIGYAMALRKPLILIGQNADCLPFDLRDYRTLIYERSSLMSTLLRPLRDAINATLKRFAVRSTPLTTSLSKASAAPTIAVTGSMHCDPTRAARRV